MTTGTSLSYPLPLPALLRTPALPYVAGLHGGSLGRVLDLERMPPDHRTGPFGSHTNPQPEFRPAASAGMATVASLGAAAPGSARSAPPGPGPGPEGQLNPWPLKIEALDTYHTGGWVGGCVAR